MCLRNITSDWLKIAICIFSKFSTCKNILRFPVFSWCKMGNGFFCRHSTRFCETQGWKHAVTICNTRLSKITGKREIWVWGLGKSNFSVTFKLWSPWHTWLCLRNAKEDHNGTCSCLHPCLSIPQTPEGRKPGTAVAARDEAQKVSLHSGVEKMSV